MSDASKPSADKPARQLSADETKPSADESARELSAVESACELSADASARLREAFTRIPYARLLGLEFVGASRGEATFALEVREELTRMGGIAHGGVLASLLDTAAAFAVHTLLAPEERTVTVDLTVHFLRPVGEGRVEARARVLRAGRRIVIISAEATDQTGLLVATATTTYVRQG
ncbi:MAG: PaaI family thioesterase [Acidobacteriota bacterium]|nr:PaaI family thioesterase [Acidobacteriota bacterium]